MKKKITIHDLAKILEIDSSTVSRALANNPRVKKKTRELIQAKAEELGYSRNVIASNLRAQKTNTIGVIVPYISRFFFSTVIAGIEEIAFNKGYRVIICQSLDQLNREQQLTKTLLSSQVDGIILSISMETDQYEHLAAIQKQEVPVVFFDRKCNAIPATNILIDDIDMAYQATTHLIKNGCQKIAHFSGSEEVSIYRDRREGYEKALVENGLSPNQGFVFESKLKAEDGERMAREILALDDKPDGIFSANDIATIAAMQVFRQNGISIPDDMAMIGFSNEPLGAYTNPPLSTVDQNPTLMGNKIAESIIQQIETKSVSQAVEIIDAALVIRDSSGQA